MLLSRKGSDTRMGQNAKAGDGVEKWRSDISKQGRSVRPVK